MPVRSGSGLPGPSDDRRPLPGLLVGSWNQLAVTGLVASIERPGETNPIFLHGGQGMGKSCLLRAYVAELRARYPAWEVVHMPGKRLLSSFQHAIYQKRIQEFRKRMREADALVVDGIDVLSAKPACQREMLETVDVLASRKRPIVLSSSVPPRRLTEFLPQLASRFLAGVTAPLHPPDASALKSLVLSWGRRQTPPLPEDALQFLSRTFRGSPAELEKLLLRLSTFRRSSRQALTPRILQEALDLSSSGYSTPDLAAITRAVVEYFGLTPGDLAAERTTRRTTLARRVAIFLATELTDLEQRQIGEAFGKRRASTVRHARADIKKRIEEDDGAIQEAVVAIKRRLGV